MREPVNCALTAMDVEGLRARLNRIRTLSRGDLRIIEHCRQISIALDKGQRKVLRIESRINKLKPHAIMENQTKKPETLKGWLQARLKKMAEEDKSFAEKMENPKKSLDECIKFIQGEVFREYVKENKGERMSCAMPSREEIFGLAVHYYDEQEVKIQQLPNGVAAKVQGGATLSEEELEKLKEKAKAKALEEFQAAEKKKLEEREKARRKAEAEKKKAEVEKKRAEREANGELSLFDLMSL